MIQYAFPTSAESSPLPHESGTRPRFAEAPVLYHAGPAGVANSKALEISGVTKDTKDPPAGQVVKDEKTGEPTGMLRNAYGVLKGVPGGGEGTAEQRRAAVLKLFGLYNQHGITSIADRSASRGNLDLYLSFQKSGELTLRINVARNFGTGGSREDIGKRLDELVGKDKRGGPTGAGDEWVRIGPIKMFLDGGMLMVPRTCANRTPAKHKIRRTTTAGYCSSNRSAPGCGGRSRKSGRSLHTPLVKEYECCSMLTSSWTRLRRSGNTASASHTRTSPAS